jgi:hypothetical protein
MAKLVPIDEAPTPRRLVPLDDAPGPITPGAVEFDPGPTTDRGVDTWQKIAAIEAKSNTEVYGFPEPRRDPSAGPAGLGPLQSMQYGLQKVGAGVADVLGAPVDLVAAPVFNAGIYGMNTLGRNVLPGYEQVSFIENPIGGSQSIRDLASSFFPTIDDAQVPDKQQIAGEAVRFGSQALGPGGVLASSANKAREVGSMVQKSPVAQSIVDNFTRGMTQPYVANAGRTLGGDVVAAGGAGAAVEGYDQYAPESVQDTLGPLGPLLAALFGGTGAAVTKAGVEGAVSGGMNAGRSLTGTNYDPNIPMDETTGYRPTRSELDQAAMIAQGQASNPALAARTIEDEAAALRAIEPRVAIPTSGALSGDVGLNLYENTKRVADAAPFIQRTQAVNTGANELIGRSAPPDAEPRALTDFAETATDQKRQQIEANAPAPQDVPVKAAMADMAPASGRLQGAFKQEDLANKAEKNANFAPLKDVPVPAQPLRDSLDSIMADRTVIGGEIPAGIVNYVKGLPDDITFGEILGLRNQVSEEIGAAFRSTAPGADGLASSGPRIQRLKQLRSALDDYENMLPPENADQLATAQGFYKNERVPRFKEGEAGKFLKDSIRDPNQRPEDFAGRFLGKNKGSDVESLNRAVPLGTNEAPSAAAVDARTWLIGKLGESGVVDDKTKILRPDVLRSFATKNREVISRVPGMQDEIDKMLAQATEGREMTGKIAAELRKVEQSTMAQMRGKNPENAVAGVFNSGDPERAIDELILEIGPDKKARDGLKGAVRDWLIDKTSTTAVEKTVDGERPTSFAQLENLFNKHEKTLAKVYSPDEMNALRDAHRLLKPMNNLRNRGTTGSDTPEKGMMGWKVLEAGLKARYGVLKGGGLLRTIRIAAETLPNSRAGIDGLTKQMFFDPDLAVFLLRREVKPDSPEWNAKLQRLIGFGAAARESTAPEGDNAEN